MSKELKPCPFCGEEMEFVSYYSELHHDTMYAYKDTHVPDCPLYACVAGGNQDKEILIKEWNTRQGEKVVFDKEKGIKILHNYLTEVKGGTSKTDVEYLKDLEDIINIKE